jgi:hypothetical protein
LLAVIGTVVVIVFLGLMALPHVEIFLPKTSVILEKKFIAFNEKFTNMITNQLKKIDSYVFGKLK